MDKRTELNIEVKEKLAAALFSLLEDRPISEITVTTLIENASVARVSFYRNYSSLEEILRYRLDTLVDRYFEECTFPTVNFSDPENMTWMFGFYRKYKRELLALQRNGLSSMLLETINDISLTYRRAADEAPAELSREERLDCYYEAGAFYNTVIHWLAASDPLPAEAMARRFCRRIKGSTS